PGTRAAAAARPRPAAPPRSRPAPARPRPAAWPDGRPAARAASAARRPAGARRCPSLRKPRKLREVRLPRLDEGVPALLRLVGQVVQQRRVAGQLLDAGQAVRVGVEGRLEEAQRSRALLEDLARPLDRLVFETIERHDRVDKPHFDRLPGVVLVGGVPDTVCTPVAGCPGTLA